MSPRVGKFIGKYTRRQIEKKSRGTTVYEGWESEPLTKPVNRLSWHSVERDGEIM